MDSGRLTPHLRRRVLDLDTLDRIALYRALGDSLRHSGDTLPEERLARRKRVMDEVSGVDVQQRSRSREVVDARAVFIFVARMEGFSQRVIARYLGQNHSTISLAEGRVRTALSMPRAYAELINLYNNYTQTIYESNT